VGAGRQRGRPCETVLAGAQPNAAQVGNYLKTRFPLSSILRRSGRAGTSDHAAGLALDFMVGTPAGNVLEHRPYVGAQFRCMHLRFGKTSGGKAAIAIARPTNSEVA
jgi:hypothetical protein